MNKYSLVLFNWGQRTLIVAPVFFMAAGFRVYSNSRAKFVFSLIIKHLALFIFSKMFIFGHFPFGYGQSA